MPTMEEMRLERERIEKARKDRVEGLISCIHFSNGAAASDVCNEDGEIEVYYKGEDFILTIKYLDEV